MGTATAATVEMVTYGRTSAGSKLHEISTGLRARCGRDMLLVRRMERAEDRQVCATCRRAAAAPARGKAAPARTTDALRRAMDEECRLDVSDTPASVRARLLDLGFATEEAGAYRLTPLGERVRRRILASDARAR